MNEGLEMLAVRRHTVHLPGGLQVTLLRLHPGLRVLTAIRWMLQADWYVLAGPTFQVRSGRPGLPDQPDLPTGYGCYVGTSDRLQARRLRLPVSFTQWTTGAGRRLDAQALVLIRRNGPPVDPHARLIVEARIARQLSEAGWTVLNQITGAPAAYRKANRQQRCWSQLIAQRLANQLIGTVFHGQQPQHAGGNAREALVRLVLRQNPARAMDTHDVLIAAGIAGIPIPGATPQQRSRRDLTTREKDTGRPRLYQTTVAGRTVVYGHHMTLQEARRSYFTAHPGAQARHARALARRRRRAGQR